MRSSWVGVFSGRIGGGPAEYLAGKAKGKGNSTH
jgi:hypothetical protein